MTELQQSAEQFTVAMSTPEVRGRDLVWATLLAAPFLATHLLTPVKMHWALLSLFVSLPLMVGALLVLQRYLKSQPGAVATSLTLTPDGVELRRPLRRPAKMAFAEISRVVASSSIDGGGESTMTLLLYGSGHRLAVGGELLMRSRLIDRIRQLRGFDSQAHGQSWADENSWRQSLFPKRTELLSRAHGR